MADPQNQRIEIHSLCVHLGFEETYDTRIEWAGEPKEKRAYRLLTRKGEYQCLSGDSEPITCDNWAQATQLYKTNGSAFIFNLREGTALYWHEPHKAWRSALIYPHPDFEKHYHDITVIKGDTRNEKKQRPTGAQRRKKARAIDEERSTEANLVAAERRKHGR